MLCIVGSCIIVKSCKGWVFWLKGRCTQIGALCSTRGKVVGLCIDLSFTPLGRVAFGIANGGFHVLMGHLDSVEARFGANLLLRPRAYDGGAHGLTRPPGCASWCDAFRARAQCRGGHLKL